MALSFSDFIIGYGALSSAFETVNIFASFGRVFGFAVLYSLAP
jgi:hypothetical protein